MHSCDKARKRESNCAGYGKDAFIVGEHGQKPSSIKRMDELLELAISIAKRAGALLQERPSQLSIDTKSSDIDIITQMDRASEKLIVEEILSARPDDGIIGEEGADRPSKSGYTWVIDPIDGTVNYLYGIPGWCISIAIKDSEGYLVGVVHAPSFAMTWSARRGGGAWTGRVVALMVHLGAVDRGAWRGPRR